MSAFKLLTATRIINYFFTAFQRKNGVAQFASIDTVNSLAAVVNTVAANQSYALTTHIRVTQDPGPGFGLTFSAMTGGGVTTCIDRCLHTDKGLQEQFCCGAALYYGINGNAVSNPITFAFLRTAPGCFDITFPENRADATGIMVSLWADTVVIPGPLATPGLIFLTKVSNTLYQLKTTDLAGVPVDGLLSNTPLQFTGYLQPSTRPDGWRNPGNQ